MTRQLPGRGQRTFRAGIALDRFFPKRGTPLCGARSASSCWHRACHDVRPKFERLQLLSQLPDDREAGGGSALAWSSAPCRSIVTGGAALCRSLAKETRGHHHACYRFTLVRHPEQFARARDGARATHRERAIQALRDLQPDRIALQRQREDMGGTLTHAEYRLKLAALERAARGKLPARATLKRPPSCHEVGTIGRERDRAQQREVAYSGAS
jgi:hypothetical protein